MAHLRFGLPSTRMTIYQPPEVATVSLPGEHGLAECSVERCTNNAMRDTDLCFQCDFTRPIREPPATNVGVPQCATFECTGKCEQYLKSGRGWQFTDHCRQCIMDASNPFAQQQGPVYDPAKCKTDDCSNKAFHFSDYCLYCSQEQAREAQKKCCVCENDTIGNNTHKCSKHLMYELKECVNPECAYGGRFYRSTSCVCITQFPFLPEDTYSRRGEDYCVVCIDLMAAKNKQYAEEAKEKARSDFWKAVEHRDTRLRELASQTGYYPGLVVEVTFLLAVCDFDLNAHQFQVSHVKPLPRSVKEADYIDKTTGLLRYQSLPEDYLKYELSDYVLYDFESCVPVSAHVRNIGSINLD